MNGLKKAIVGLGLVGLLSSPYLVSRANAEEPKKQEASQLEKEANSYFGTKAPDEVLYKLIEVYNQEKSENLYQSNNYDSLIQYCKNFVDILEKYNITKLNLNAKRVAAQIYDDFGSGLYGKKQYEESIPFNKKATELDPDNQLFWRNLALTYKELGKSKNNRIFLLRSIEFYKKVIELNGKYSEEAQKVIEVINTKYLPNSN